MSRIAEDAYGDKPVSYPRTPGFKQRTTSREAARSMTAAVPTLKEKVLAAVIAAGERELTADEAAEKVGATVLAIRPRVTELSIDKKIAFAGETRPNESGRNAQVWRAA